MDLPIFTEYRSGQITSSDPTQLRRHLPANALGTGAKSDGLAPFVTIGNPDRDTGGIEQPRRGLGDALQRGLSITWRAGNSTQDVGARVLAIPGEAEFALQPGIFLRGRGLAGNRGVMRGETGFESLLQLGYGLGLAMGAKLAKPDKLCINVWGDAAIGFTGMDFETAVRERSPIMSILLNNFSMAIELKVMPISTEKYRSTDISGDYAAMARAFGGYGERVTKPEDIIPAIKRGIEKTRAGIPVLLEFITSKETEVSRPGT